MRPATSPWATSFSTATSPPTARPTLCSTSSLATPASVITEDPGFVRAGRCVGPYDPRAPIATIGRGETGGGGFASATVTRYRSWLSPPKLSSLCSHCFGTSLSGRCTYLIVFLCQVYVISSAPSGPWINAGYE